MSFSIKRSALAQLLRWLTHLFGATGVAFIVYGAVSQFTGETWKPLDQIAATVSPALTLIGSGVMASSVFLFSSFRSTPPEAMSCLTALIVIILCAAGLIAMVTVELSPTIVNGFAIAGMAGGLSRILPNPYFAQDSN